MGLQGGIVLAGFLLTTLFRFISHMSDFEGDYNELTTAESEMIIDLLYDLRKGMEREAG